MVLSCFVCSGEKFDLIIDQKPSMSSDGQTVSFAIQKEECCQCGTVRSKDISFLDDFYSSTYKLNIQNTDPLFVYNGIGTPKSVMHFEWINELSGESRIAECSNMIEIGCGSGNLLSLFPVKEKFGVEPSKVAAMHAAKVANVRNIGYGQISEEENYDFILSTCVVEHTVDPNDFLQKIHSIAHSGSLIVIGLPLQDTESFDVYFLDHLHHFTVNQFKHICTKNGFTVRNYSVAYKCITTLGYFILEKAKNQIAAGIQNEISFEKNINFYISQNWINNLNEFLNKYSNSSLIAFGYGETSFFFQSYTELNKVIKCYVDDTRVDFENNVLSVEKAIELNLLNNCFLILLTNPHYHNFIAQKFDAVKTINFYSPFSNQLFT